MRGGEGEEGGTDRVHLENMGRGKIEIETQVFLFSVSVSVSF